MIVLYSAPLEEQFGVTQIVAVVYGLGRVGDARPKMGAVGLIGIETLLIPLIDTTVTQ